MLPALRESPSCWHRGLKLRHKTGHILQKRGKQWRGAGFESTSQDGLHSSGRVLDRSEETFRILSISYVTEKKGSNWSENIISPTPPKSARLPASAPAILSLSLYGCSVSAVQGQPLHLYRGPPPTLSCFSSLPWAALSPSLLKHSHSRVHVLQYLPPSPWPPPPIPSSRHLIPIHTSQQNCWKELSGVTVSIPSSFYPSPLHGGCSYRGHQWLLHPLSVLLSEVSVRMLSAERGRMSHLKRLKQYGHLLLRELSSHWTRGPLGWLSCSVMGS